ncbi:MAG TPA: ATP-dependent DNA helicase RecG, partial [Tepidisphaeraceae bacterium]|nr:ATP-dependent DNA helicase RecG [Tepidisphaeraceae bacterium]
DSPTETLAPMTARRVKLLRQLDILTLGDLIEHFPHRYQYEAAEGLISDLVEGQIHTVRGEVVACDYIAGRGKPRFEATLQDESREKLAVVWFNGHYFRRTIHPGIQIRVQGTVRIFRNIPQMANPKMQRVDSDDPPIVESRIRPIYPASADLKSDEIERIIGEHLPSALPLIEDFLDEDRKARHQLISRAEAFQLIHQPQTLRDGPRARRRLIYDELLLMQLGLGISKSLRDGRVTAPQLKVDRMLDERIRRRFPFALTAAQTRAIHQILRDLQSGAPMNRLLQGDVGSGKTSVAVYAMLVAVANKMQAAILAPTEVLAEQHYLTLCNLMKGSSVNVGLFTQRTKRLAKGELNRALSNGDFHLAVGTQALLQQDIEFANLGLVVVDEQHKLGVKQRAKLKTKGYSPHYLVMTATPIPRTLALSYFADFDLSVIDELPPGRTPIRTSLFRSDQSTPAWDFVRKQIEAGRQAYVVLPQIEESPTEDIKSVKAEYDRLRKGPLEGLTLAMLHGELSTEEKQAVMQEFRSGTTQVLVATTVIEVGVDVVNATVMVIESAERFGLAQLHQLRGRVGRGEHESFCILISDTQTDAAVERLQAMCRTNDGFEIAEIDLQQRGPGEFFGTRQSGLPEMKLADITREIELLQICREDAKEILTADPRLAASSRRTLRNALVKQFGDTIQLAAIG